MTIVGTAGRKGDGAAANLSNAERLVSAASGTLLVFAGLYRRDIAGVGLGLVGGVLVRRGANGRSRLYGSLGVSTRGGRLHADHADVHPDEALSVRRTVTVMRARPELYALWLDLELLPRFMDPLERVEALSETRSHWVARGPAGLEVEWQAEVTEAREGERIAWRTVEPTDVAHRGEVRFRPAPGGRGTEVTLALAYEPPAGGVGRAVAGVLDHPPGGRAGRAVAELLGASPAAQVRTALRRFKQVAEAGEVPTTAGQPSGRTAEGYRP